jgi:6-phosphogluconolactonase
MNKLFFCLAVFGLQFGQATWGKDCLVFFGTYTNEFSKGIYVSKFDLNTGKLSGPNLANATPNPNFLAVSPDGMFLYATTQIESFKGKTGGAVSVFAIDGHSGNLRLVDEESSGGAGPCHVDVDATGRNVFAANYSSGSVKSFHVNADGTLAAGTFIQHQGHGSNSNRQSTAHAHCFVPAPEGRFALACDLGTDKVMIYRYDPSNALLTTHGQAYATVAPGSGPRHLTFSPDGKTVYVVNEMACTMAAFDWDGLNGKLDLRQTIGLLPSGAAVKSSYTAAEIAVRPDGGFVYASVRGHDSVSVFAVDRKTGNLSLVENVPSGGKVPRGMGIDPTGHWLIVANQASGTASVFDISADTGHMIPMGQIQSVGTPVDVKFVLAQ